MFFWDTVYNVSSGQHGRRAIMTSPTALCLCHWIRPYKWDVQHVSGVYGWSSVLRPRQHSIGYMGDSLSFYRSKDPTNSIKVLKGHIQYINNRKIH